MMRPCRCARGWKEQRQKGEGQAVDISVPQRGWKTAGDFHHRICPECFSQNSRTTRNRPIMAMPMASFPAMPIAIPTTVPNPALLA